MENDTINYRVNDTHALTSFGSSNGVEWRVGSTIIISLSSLEADE